MNITNTQSPINNQYSLSTKFNSLSDKSANNMPNGLIKVIETQNSKNIKNNLSNSNLRQIYTAKLAPSAGSVSENFLKSRSNFSPVYKFNEAASKYEMISLAPLFLKQIKKHIDLIV